MIRERKGKNGTRYQAIVRRAGHPPITKTFGKLKAAQAFERKADGDIENGVASPRLAAKSTTLAQIIDDYLPTTQSFKDWRAVTTRVAFWRRTLGAYSLANITSERIANTLDDYAVDHEPASCNRMLSALRQILKVAVRRELITTNPAAKEFVANRKEPIGRQRTITEAEWKRLSKAAARSSVDELLPLLVILKESAMRLSEAHGLSVDRVDLARGTAQLFVTKTDRPRVVALTPPAVAALRSLVPAPDGQFFRCGQDELRYAFRVALKAAGIGVDARGEPIVFHTFRHSLASALAANGATIFEMKAVTGHARTASLERYVKDKDSTAHDALKRLAASKAAK